MGGFRYVNGYPGNPPVRPNISLGDSLAGLHAALGVVLGLLARDQLRNVTRAELGTKNEGRTRRTGQVIDVAIYEAVLNMMEGIVPEFDRLGEVRSFLVGCWEEFGALGLVSEVYEYRFASCRFVSPPARPSQALSRPTHTRARMASTLL